MQHTADRLHRTEKSGLVAVRMSVINATGVPMLRMPRLNRSGCPTAWHYRQPFG
jgi:hypothetical protein